MKCLNSKEKITIGIMLLIVIILIFITMFKNNDRSNNINSKISNENIELKFSKDFKYFANSIEELGKVLIADLSSNNVKVVNHSREVKTSGKSYEYNIELDNGDVINLYSDKENAIRTISYKGKISETGKYAGKFIGTIARLYIKELNAEEFEDELNNTFLSDENLSKTFGESYVYSHILFGWTKLSELCMITFDVVPEENQEQYKERLENEAKAKEEQAKQEAEERVKKEAEEKKKLEEKKRTFTAGTYIVGKDIDPGTYNMIAVSGRGNCYVSSTSSVIETFTPGGDKYAIDKYNNVKLSSGGTIEVTSTLKIKFEPIS